MKKIKKAVIATAGLGTRMLPVTKAIQKEMLPILDKPVIDYVVNDCVTAGVDEIIFVVNDRNSQIKDYFSADSKLFKFLKYQNKLDAYEKVSSLHKKAEFQFIVQKPDNGYGTAVPLKLAKNIIKNEEAFLFLTGDDILVSRPKTFWLRDLINTFMASESSATLTVTKVPKTSVSKYGVVKYKTEKGIKQLVDFVEKPTIEEAPSNYINISKYIFTTLVFDILENQNVDPKYKELLVTDTVVGLLKNNNVSIYDFKGKYLDTGNVKSWLSANLYFSKTFIY